MESKVKVLGHPIHPILIVFPLGLLATGVVFDVLRGLVGNAEFSVVSFWMIAAGVVGGLIAALFGLLDWLHIPGGTRAKSIGLMHGGGNVIVVALFLLALLLRRDEPGYTAETTPFILELLGAALAVVTGWLGGELVDRLGIGVDEGANPNAPSSLSGLPASQTVTNSNYKPAPQPQARR